MGDLACTPGEATPAQQDGPFYSPRTPLRRDIRSATASATPLIVRGRVVNTACQPLAGAVLDFWQTGDNGTYDNQGYGYRCHQFTDEQGRFELVTIRPRAYTGVGVLRSPHIHLKVQGPNTALLTSQLYLPDEQEANAKDDIYVPALLLKFVGSAGGARIANFDFVLAQS
jgi:protocatechuate 3,4-dioxygenase beta subunit